MIVADRREGGRVRCRKLIIFQFRWLFGPLLALDLRSCLIIIKGLNLVLLWLLKGLVVSAVDVATVLVLERLHVFGSEAVNAAYACLLLLFTLEVGIQIRVQKVRWCYLAFRLLRHFFGASSGELLFGGRNLVVHLALACLI